MPELPEVETIVRGLRKQLVGRKLEQVEIRRPEILRGVKGPLFRELKGAMVRDIRRRGKHILIHLSNGWSLVIHLKMTGRLNWMKEDACVEKHTHAIFHLSDCPFQVHFCDTRRFGFLMASRTECLGQMPPLRDLGPEPLEIDQPDFVTQLSRRTGRIKSLLLNQHFLAGIGNIYADESLWDARIHPHTPAHRISPVKARRLHHSIRNILEQAIEHGGSSIDTYRNSDNLPGRHQFHLNAYGRQGEPCRRCGSRIRRIVTGGRSSFFCPRCQRESRA
jgi:formamidopyrimidine-DNA glycosylase